MTAYYILYTVYYNIYTVYYNIYTLPHISFVYRTKERCKEKSTTAKTFPSRPVFRHWALLGPSYSTAYRQTGLPLAPPMAAEPLPFSLISKIQYGI